MSQARLERPDLAASESSFSTSLSPPCTRMTSPLVILISGISTVSMLRTPRSRYQTRIEGPVAGRSGHPVPPASLARAAVLGFFLAPLRPEMASASRGRERTAYERPALARRRLKRQHRGLTWLPETVRISSSSAVPSTGRGSRSSSRQRAFRGCASSITEGSPWCGNHLKGPRGPSTAMNGTESPIGIWAHCARTGVDGPGRPEARLSIAGPEPSLPGYSRCSFRCRRTAVMVPSWSTENKSQCRWRPLGRDMYLPGSIGSEANARNAAARSAPLEWPADLHFPSEFWNRKSKSTRRGYPIGQRSWRRSAAGLVAEQGRCCYRRRTRDRALARFQECPRS
jgi:hypothetical protein